MSMYGKPNRLGELKCLDESRTKQSFEEEANINVIFARAIQNGWDPRLLPQVEATYADVTEVGDFRTAQERVLRGLEIFEKLSARDRLEFGNDPGRFFEFAMDPANVERVQEMRFGKEAVDALRAERGRAAGVSPGVRGSVAGDRGPDKPAAGAGGDRAVSVDEPKPKGDGSGGDRGA